MSHNCVALSGINVRNRLPYAIKNVAVIYCAGDKYQQRSLLAIDYWFDWKFVDVATGQNVVFKKVKQIGDVSSKSEVRADGFECSTLFRGYWQLYWEVDGRTNQLNKNNAQVNVWNIDDNGEMEITILNEEEDIRVDFKLPSGNAYFYAKQT